MQNSTHNNLDDKFAMNFNNFDTEALFNPAHMGGINLGLKRTAHDAGLDHREGMGLSSDDEDEDDDDGNMKKEGNINRRGLSHHHQSSSTTRGNVIQHHQTNIEDHQHHHSQHHHQKQNVLPNGKKTKGRVKIKMEFIDNKLRRYTTFSKRKTGIMKKAYELSTLTGTQVMLLVASETGHVYTFATRKLQPMITSEAGKQLIQTCLNSPDPPQSGGAPHQHDQRMSATGYEETELTYAVTEEEHKSPSMGSEEYLNGSSYSGSDCSSPPTPSGSPTPTHDAYFPQSASTSSSTHATSDSIINSSSSGSSNNSNNEKKIKNEYNNGGGSGGGCSSSSVINSVGGSETQSGSHLGINPSPFPLHLPPGLIFTSSVTGGSVVVGSQGGSLMYSPTGNVVYSPNPGSLHEGGTNPLLLNLPQGLHLPTEGDSQGGGRQLVGLSMKLASAAVLQQSAAAAAVVSAAAATSSGGGGFNITSLPSSTYSSNGSSSQSSGNTNFSILNESLPTDLSLHIKREDN